MDLVKAQDWGDTSKHWLLRKLFGRRKTWVVRRISGEMVYWYNFITKDWDYVCDAHEQPIVTTKGVFVNKKTAKEKAYHLNK